MMKEIPNPLISGNGALKEIHASVDKKDVVIKLYCIQFVV